MFTDRSSGSKDSARSSRRIWAVLVTGVFSQTRPTLETVPSCAEGGVLGVLPGIIGTMQALEAIKLILGKGESLLGRLVHFDALNFKFREVRLRKDPQCPVCGDQPSITELIDYDQFCGTEGEDTSDQAQIPEISVLELKELMDGSTIELIDVREPAEFEIGRIPGSRLIPLSELPDRLGEIPGDKKVYVHCKAGGRSAKVVRMMQEAGKTNGINVAGGINAWSEEIDPSVPKY